ncbi:MAG: O-acetyl-ADP-ribose deacetylase [Bryobacterales bacterium]|nr:O-acetyl-ADP-ribose deacetylase [Bryobacterales bacterium]
MQHLFPNGRLLRLVQGDITTLPADAICNAANSALRPGGGIDGSIHRAGGPAILHELDSIRKKNGACPPGSAVATTAGNLPARYVFHAVGPVYSGGGNSESQVLASCYRACLALADERKVQRISFPSISTGIYGYPLEEAAPVAIETVAEWLTENDTSVKEAIFVLFDEATRRAYERALADV